MELTRIQVKWVFFTSYSIVIPCFYFLFVAAGFLPLIFILLSSIQQGGDFLIFIIHILHCGIYGALFYGSATVTSKAIFLLKNRYARHLILAVILILLFIVAMLPVYGVAHNNMQWKNWFEIMGELRLWLRG